MNAPHPAKAPPQRIVLDGRYVRLEPIGPQHVTSLYRAIALGWHLPALLDSVAKPAPTT